MNTLIKKLFLLCLVGSFIFISACSEDEVPAMPKNIVELAVENNFNILAAALTQAGLVDDLEGSGPFTVFAPTDAAFEAAGITESNVGSVEGLETVLLYHVIVGEVTSDMLSTTSVASLSGKYIDIDASALTVNDANIISPIDVDASNGVIHTIDKVLLPKNNIVEAASASSDLSTLVTVLGKYPDLVSTLSDETGNFTVFAPTNTAFASLLAAIGQTDINDVPESVVKSILQYHVLPSEVVSTDLSDGLSALTVQGEEIVVNASGESFVINGVTINTADLSTSNGIVHILDGVLVPNSIGQFVNTIVEPAYFNKNFSTLIAAVTSASPAILETLLGAGPGGNGMTLFAPTNAAFVAANITALPDQATLDAILAYHLVDGTILSTQLPSTSVAAPIGITTVAGGDFYLTNKGNGVYLNGLTQVTATDIDPSEGAGNANGVVHVISRTLLPPADDIVQLALDNGYTELAAALTEAGLIGTLEGTGPFTVFAPTNAAFTQLYAALGVANASEVDDATLDAVLKYHVLQGRVFSSDLSNGLVATSISNGATFTVNIAEGVTITDGNGNSPDANVTATDVFGTNGIVHEIDRVILPN